MATFHHHHVTYFELCGQHFLQLHCSPRSLIVPQILPSFLSPLFFLLSFSLCTKIEYHSEGVDDFALYLPSSLVPSKRVLLLRYRNRFEALAQSLQIKGITVTSAYPVTWMRREWSPHEERAAGEVDGEYVKPTACEAAALSLVIIAMSIRLRSDLLFSSYFIQPLLYSITTNLTNSAYRFL